MKKIVFFSLPAHGHTNPTLPVVAELTKRGHQVWYFSFDEFREKIEGAGATFIGCDRFLPKFTEQELEKKVGRDFAALIEMVADTTIALEPYASEKLADIQPDCIVSDSIAAWGKLFAKKLGIPYICSTTTFAFNEYTAKSIRPGAAEIWLLLRGMRRIRKKIKQLNDHGFPVKNFIALIQNDNETDTIVYTSKEFQPMSDTFSKRYAFVGASIPEHIPQPKSEQRKRIYISLGTILNRNPAFYRNCFQAFAHEDYEVVLSAGEKTDLSLLPDIPDNFTVQQTVDQIAVLHNTDVFLTHCGMNSVSESLYFGVPMVLFPQHSEQKMIANRVAELGAGVLLKGTTPKELETAVAQILSHPSYQHQAQQLSASFQFAGGATEAARVILAICRENS
ncbi:macrolide family glycosyltransferase [Planococcus sp. ISL-109]|uniref:macrolide family glycosyltransferase n=1 Tax=Planococcus sp. ISL-109 TaxID=2819166 RepID=UPI001BE9D4CB|nr:macrolide family glycosyltransferase [Planococcus sp. ISL-109]MBT2582609.1 glucosyltransferase [Planococcus sp. ISL-109]